MVRLITPPPKSRSAPTVVCAKCRIPRRHHARGMCQRCYQGGKNRGVLTVFHERCGAETMADLDALEESRRATMPDETPEWFEPKPLRTGHELTRGYKRSPHGAKCPLIPLLLADVPVTPAMMDADRWLRTTGATMTGLTARTRDNGLTVELRRGRKLVMTFARAAKHAAAVTATPTARQKAVGRLIEHGRRFAGMPRKGGR